MILQDFVWIFHHEVTTRASHVKYVYSIVTERRWYTPWSSSRAYIHGNTLTYYLSSQHSFNRQPQCWILPTDDVIVYRRKMIHTVVEFLPSKASPSCFGLSSSVLHTTSAQFIIDPSLITFLYWRMHQADRYGVASCCVISPCQMLFMLAVRYQSQVAAREHLHNRYLGR